MTMVSYDVPSSSGQCPCGALTTSRCACGGWWCSACLSRHTGAPGGRCPTVVGREREFQRQTDIMGTPR